MSKEQKIIELIPHNMITSFKNIVPKFTEQGVALFLFTRDNSTTAYMGEELGGEDRYFRIKRWRRLTGELNEHDIREKYAYTHYWMVGDGMTVPSYMSYLCTINERSTKERNKLILYKVRKEGVWIFLPNLIEAFEVMGIQWRVDKHMLVFDGFADNYQPLDLEFLTV